MLFVETEEGKKQKLKVSENFYKQANLKKISKTHVLHCGEKISFADLDLWWFRLSLFLNGQESHPLFNEKSLGLTIAQTDALLRITMLVYLGVTEEINQCKKLRKNSVYGVFGPKSEKP